LVVEERARESLALRDTDRLASGADGDGRQRVAHLPALLALMTPCSPRPPLSLPQSALCSFRSLLSFVPPPRREQYLLGHRGALSAAQVLGLPGGSCRKAR